MLNQQSVRRIHQYSFKMNNLLGKGATGEVYLGEDTNNGTKVACKIIDMAKIDNEVTEYLLANEKRALSTLRHGNIIKTLDIFQQKDYCYIVTEFCNQGTLLDIIQAKGRLSEEEALPLFKQIVQGYRICSQKGVIHRDLKPANILMHNDTPLISDFGYCEIIGVPKPKIFYNVGSPSYMSPQAFVVNLYSEKSDVWSLGVVLYEMLVGHTFDGGGDIMECISSVGKHGVPYPEHISQYCRYVINQCLNLDPSKRIGLQDLIKILDRKQVPASDNNSKKDTVTVAQAAQFSRQAPSLSMIPSQQNLPIDMNSQQQNIITRPTTHSMPSMTAMTQQNIPSVQNFPSAQQFRPPPNQIFIPFQNRRPQNVQMPSGFMNQQTIVRPSTQQIMPTNYRPTSPYQMLNPAYEHTFGQKGFEQQKPLHDVFNIEQYSARTEDPTKRQERSQSQLLRRIPSLHGNLPSNQLGLAHQTERQISIPVYERPSNPVFRPYSVQEGLVRPFTMSSMMNNDSNKEHKLVKSVIHGDNAMQQLPYFTQIPFQKPNQVFTGGLPHQRLPVMKPESHHVQNYQPHYEPQVYQVPSQSPISPMYAASQRAPQPTNQLQHQPSFKKPIPRLMTQQPTMEAPLSQTNGFLQNRQLAGLLRGASVNRGLQTQRVGRPEQMAAQPVTTFRPVR